MKYSYPCGCSFDIIEGRTTKTGMPALDITMDNIPESCPFMWQMLSEGKSKGVWQLDSRLGKKWTEEIKPESIEDLGAIGALVRPGALKSITDGKCATQHYADRKNKKAKIEPYHPSVDKCLDKTYGVLSYQEQSMRLAQEIAGFNLQEADMLRKAIGKKIASEMAKVKELFLKKAKEANIVTEEQAKEIFSWIEKSQRYSFNKCISGDTCIKRCARGKYNCNLTVEEMFKIRTDIQYAKASGHLSLYKKWKLLGNYSKGLSLCKDKRIRPNIIKDIRHIGKETCYRILLENGSFIDVTDTHKFPSPTGEKMCKELKKDDELYLCGEYQSDFINNEKIIPKECAICHKTKCRFELHHINGDRTNSSISNLQRLCPSCHKIQEYKNGRIKRGQKGYPFILSKIISITNIGEKDVFDVEMDCPNHNFTTDKGIVTCNSHSIEYGILSEITAYIKAHNALAFFDSWLLHSSDKIIPQKEIRELISEAKKFDIIVDCPDIRDGETNFYIAPDMSIRFGLCDIKDVGSSVVNKIKEVFNNKNISWTDFLLNFSKKINKRALGALILSGSMDYMGVPRTRMEYELSKWLLLTEREKEIIVCEGFTTGKGYSALEKLELYKKYSLLEDKFVLSSDDTENIFKLIKDYKPINKKNLLSAIEDLKKTKNFDKKREIVINSIIASLKKPPYPLIDTIDRIASEEQKYLGVPVSHHKTENTNFAKANTTCKEFTDGKTGFTVLDVEIDEVSTIKIKKAGSNYGKEMSFVTISDSTQQIDGIVAFPDVWEKTQHLLVQGNMVSVRLGRDKKKNSPIIEEVWQL